MDRIRLRQEKVCLLCVGTTGDERRCLTVFHALAYFVYLCDTVQACVIATVQLCFIMDVTIVTIYGCHLLTIYWIILNSFFTYKKICYLIRRYGPVPLIFCVATENSLSKSFLDKYGAQIKK